MTIYIKEKNLVECLDAREVAPAAATRDMFVNATGKASLEGGLSIAVPGELKGMWELHKKYGKLKWSEVIQPIIDLCQKGHIVTEYLARVLRVKETDIKSIPSLAEIFVDPNTKEIWNENDRIKRPELAKTLEIIAKEGADTVYKMGKIGKQLVDDIKEFGGIVTEDDIKNYQVKWTRPLVTTMKNGEKLYTMPLSGSGSILVFVMNLLKGFDMKPDALSYHRMIEAFKFAYARRADLADPKFWPKAEELEKNLTSMQYANEVRKRIDDEITHEPDYYGAHFDAPNDHGTAHISVLAPNGDAVSATGTINYILGSLRRSKTGIILNDEMDDFSTPGKINVYGIAPSEANYVEPGKRPMSSMAPTIIIKPDGNVGMIVGSAGGSRITTSITQAIVQHFLMGSNMTLAENFASDRLHHQLLPNSVEYEKNFNGEILKGLEARNHTMKMVTVSFGFGALVGVTNEEGKISAAYDPRRGGSANVF